MAGGIISGGNGVVTQGASNVVPSVIVPTVLQISRDVVNQFTGLTCLYDRYWYVRQDKVTFPVCFFHVKKITEVMQTTLSQKRLMVYEPQLASCAQRLSARQAADPLRKSVLEVASDNAVKSPKSYSMEIVLPFLPVSAQYIRSVNDVNQLIFGFMRVAGLGNVAAGTLEFLTTSLLQVLREVSSALEVGNLLPNESGVTMTNKNSLEAMWESKRILTMKMWTGYQYKYVMITGLSIDKNPIEDDVFRATMSVQEVPVLNVTPVQPTAFQGPQLTGLVEAATRIQNALIKPLVAITGAEAASGKTDPVGATLSVADQNSLSSFTQ